MRSLVTSTAPLVYNRLIEVLGDLTVGMGENGVDVKVEDGGDYSSWSGDEIWVQDITEATSDVPTMKADRLKRDESFRLKIRVRTVRIDRKDSRDAAFALMGVLEGFLAENPDLGLDIPTLRATTVEWTYEANYDEGVRGWRSSLAYLPLFEARLR